MAKHKDGCWYTDGDPPCPLEGRLVQLEAKQQTDRRMSEAHDKRFEKLEAQRPALDNMADKVVELEARLEALEQLLEHHMGYHEHRYGSDPEEQQAAPPALQPREGAV